VALLSLLCAAAGWWSWAWAASWVGGGVVAIVVAIVLRGGFFPKGSSVLPSLSGSFFCPS
jgi:hypothetical protein